jgi:hypothetical protein
VLDGRPQSDRILVARLAGQARHHARWRELTGDEEDAAVAALRELAGGRADLLAEVAGILEGFSEGELDESRSRQAAMLCRKAGADPEAIAAWIAEGRRRRDAARTPPIRACSPAESQNRVRVMSATRAAAGRAAARSRAARSWPALVMSISSGAITTGTPQVIRTDGRGIRAH